MVANRSGAGGKPGVKRQQAVSVEEIAETALRILDAEGLEALTMRRLAGEMGVRPVTLYRYLPDKEAILAVVADKLWTQLLATPASGGGWRERVRAAWLDLHNLMQEHPHATPMIARAGTYSATAAAANAGMLETLREAGFPPEVASDLMHAVGATVVGFAFATLWERLEREGRRPQVPAGSSIQPAPPDLQTYGRQVAPWRPDQFGIALDILLDGFERRLQTARP